MSKFAKLLIWCTAIALISALPIYSVTNGKLNAKPHANASNKVEIIGFDGDAMEPFISCDGNTLYFNNSNHPRVNTNIYKAKRINGHQFSFDGEVKGINSAQLDGVASIDCQNQFYFISTRNYINSFASVFTANFNIQPIAIHEVENISRGRLGDLIFDAEISRDGNILAAVDGIFRGGPVPKSADIFLAQKTASGFQRIPNNQFIMQNINSHDLEYAPSLSTDKKTLYFTRIKNRFLHQEFTIEMARRTNINDAFGQPIIMIKSNNSIEAPSISMDNKTLYYHEKIRGKFVIFKLDLQ